MAKKKIIVNCPKCDEKFSYYSSDYRPFCSERCKMIDLGQWFRGDYTVASEKPLDDSDLAIIEREISAAGGEEES